MSEDLTVLRSELKADMPVAGRAEGGGESSRRGSASARGVEQAELQKTLFSLTRPWLLRKGLPSLPRTTFSLTGRRVQLASQ